MWKTKRNYAGRFDKYSGPCWKNMFALITLEASFIGPCVGRIFFTFAILHQLQIGLAYFRFYKSIFCSSSDLFK